MPRPRSPIQLLYEKLIKSSEIPVTERNDIFSKGLYNTAEGKKEIYIKETISLREKLKVLLHEYSHHIHLTHYHQQKESRAECEIIANGSAFFICREFQLKLFKEVELSKFSEDAVTVERVSAAIQAVSGHILNGLRSEDDA